MATMVSKLEGERVGQVSKPEGPAAKLESCADSIERAAALHTSGRRLALLRVQMGAATRDVGEVANLSHTTVSEIEAGRIPDGRHHPKIRRALLRIAFAKLETNVQVIREVVRDLTAEEVA